MNTDTYNNCHYSVTDKETAPFLSRVQHRPLQGLWSGKETTNVVIPLSAVISILPFRRRMIR